jgi:hypothetical protein
MPPHEATPRRLRAQTLPVVHGERAFAQTITLCGQNILVRFRVEPFDNRSVVRELPQSLNSCQCEFQP